jgi:hypothetical protein
VEVAILVPNSPDGLLIVGSATGGSDYLEISCMEVAIKVRLYTNYMAPVL